MHFFKLLQFSDVPVTLKSGIYIAEQLSDHEQQITHRSSSKHPKLATIGFLSETTFLYTLVLQNHRSHQRTPPIPLMSLHNPRRAPNGFSFTLFEVPLYFLPLMTGILPPKLQVFFVLKWLHFPLLYFLAYIFFTFFLP